MNKLVWIIGGSVLLVMILVGLVVLGGRDMLQLQVPVVVKEASIVTYIEGVAHFRSDQDDEWLPAKIGAKIREGYQLQTGSDGLVDIRLLTGNVVRMRENTLLAFDDLTLKKQTVNIEAGRLFGKFTQIFKDQQIRINTPTVAAGVRGTELAFNVTENNGKSQTEILSLSGITEIANPQFPENKILLAFQSKTIVAQGQPPKPPIDMSPTEIRTQRKTFNSLHAEKILLVSYDIRFEPDSATILEFSQSNLDWLYRLIKQSSYRILIAGHTADIGIAVGQYRLSVQRSLAIKEYLVSRGIKESRLEAQGFGGSRPIADNDTEEGRAQNRRVVFSILD